MPIELYKKYRPRTLADMIGQADAVRILTDMIRRKAVPHFLLFGGPSGVGKTTAARAIAQAIGCAPSGFNEINAASRNGVDMVRELVQIAPMSPMEGRAKIYCLDESHQITTPAQQAALKLLEDTPQHAYFIMCTTEPDKLIPTIRTRATRINFNPIGLDDLLALIAKVVDAEQLTVSETVQAAIAEAAQGSARAALVTLERAAAAGADDASQLASLDIADQQTAAIDICRALFNNKPWKVLGPMLRDCAELKNDTAESMRHMVLAYCTKAILDGNARAVQVAWHFVANFYDSKRTGFILACHAASTQK